MSFSQSSLAQGRADEAERLARGAAAYEKEGKTEAANALRR